jgi:hypothetical protein
MLQTIYEDVLGLILAFLPNDYIYCALVAKRWRALLLARGKPVTRIEFSAPSVRLAVALGYEVSDAMFLRTLKSRKQDVLEVVKNHYILEREYDYWLPTRPGRSTLLLNQKDLVWAHEHGLPWEPLLILNFLERSSRIGYDEMVQLEQLLRAGCPWSCHVLEYRGEYTDIIEWVHDKGYCVCSEGNSSHYYAGYSLAI